MPSVTHSTVATVWRIEAPRLLGGLIRFTRSVDEAEDLAQEALLAALEHWPAEGVPQNPGAWLMATAKNRALDRVRRAKMVDRKHAALGFESPTATEPVEPGVGDDVLRLMLIACHPLLPREGRIALTLKLLGGLSNGEIARAFLLPEPTIAQRIVRAKRTLTEAQVPFEVPGGIELEARLPSVLEVIYLIFNEGYAAESGTDWIRPELCQDAMRLGRILAALAPKEAETHGLVALMELHASRLRTRVDKNGRPILLDQQNRARWDHTLIQHGLASLERAETLKKPLGVYTLQAAIAACHARARTPESTDWPRIVGLYDALAELTLSPIVELNRAIAVAMAFGPEAGLELVDQLRAEGSLNQYHLLFAARGDLLQKLGRHVEAQGEFERALALAKNEPERALLTERLEHLACLRGQGSS
jgi:RNA polymerase sigma factor (sigma-70 family)